MISLLHHQNLVNVAKQCSAWLMSQKEAQDDFANEYWSFISI